MILYKLFGVFLALAAFAANASPPVSPGGPRVYETDAYGTYYWVYIFPGNQNIETPWHKIYVSTAKSETPEITTPDNGIIISPKNESASTKILPTTNDTKREFDNQLEKNEYANEVEKGANSRRFGDAGIEAASQAIAYGVVAQAVTSADQSKIAKLKLEIYSLNEELRKQSDHQVKSVMNISLEAGKRNNSIANVFADLAGLPTISVAHPHLTSTDGTLLFATHDPAFALRLSNIANQIEVGLSTSQLSLDLRDAGLSAIRLADLEHAVGDASEAEGWVNIAQTIADFGLGLDPITGAVRSVVELVTGINVVTGEQLGVVEQTIAVINVATLGSFGTLGKSTKAIAKFGSMIGGRASTLIKKSLIAANKMLPFDSKIIRRGAFVGLSKEIAERDELFKAAENALAIARQSNLPPVSANVVGGPAKLTSRSGFRSAVLRNIRDTSQHPLKFLLTSDGRLRSGSGAGITADVWAEMPEMVEAAHVVSAKAISRTMTNRDRFMLMSKWHNRMLSGTIEHPSIGGYVSLEYALDIEGIPVHAATAYDWVAKGLLDPDYLAAARKILYD